MIGRCFPIIILSALISNLGISQNEYQPGPNSEIHEKIPRGTVSKYTWESKIYPNTTREYYIYVPVQYDPSEPAALMIFQDGHTYIKEDGNFKVATVFDNLISQKKMPVTIGLFINPGHNKAAAPSENPWRVSNRSIEYDDLSDTYARFLLEEMIPEVKKKYNISADPKLRAICGISSGGICAFTAAWNFPDQFHKVLSQIGSFTNIRGGHNYEALIRKTDKKDIKVFLQDGSNDLDNEHGNWWLANLQMEAALKFKEYEYLFVPGTGGHNDHHGAAILPESLIWLWSDVVPKLIGSSLYSYPGQDKTGVMIKGETTHLREMEFRTVIFDNNQPMELSHQEKEQIIIIKAGEIEVILRNEKKVLGPQSVIVIAPQDKGMIRSITPSAEFYTMIYQARNIPDLAQAQDQKNSFMVDFNSISFKPHDRGGVRSYFNRSSAMCPYYEMHVTSLNAGIKSHEPHTHVAEEIILMISGQTEMQIGNDVFKGKAGDVYFAGANVPHAIRNTGAEPCMYFAFQWN